MDLDQIRKMPEEKKEILISLGYRHVEPDDRSLFNRYYDKMLDQKWSSPMSFMAYIAWDSSFYFFYRVIGEYLVTIAWDAEFARMIMLPFMGKYDQKTLEETFAEVLKDHEKLGASVVIMDLYEWMLPYYKNIPEIEWEEDYDRDIYDYVYKAEDYGVNFKKKSGQNCRFFMRNNDYRVEEIHEEHLDLLRDFTKKYWCGYKKCEECEFGCPLECVERVVPVFTKIGGYGIIIYISGELAGYCIGSRYADYAILQFQVTAGEIHGLGVFMYTEIMKRFLDGVKIINMEEDLGDNGIRTFKTRLAPYKLAKRVEIRLKG